tara:strand:+ start:905 stop:1657 length:753 start_codon:yes stop_codon:yes gene_type:complete
MYSVFNSLFFLENESIDKNDLSLLEQFEEYYPTCFNIYKITSAIIILDFLLCNLFNTKARWFQLHCLVNLYIGIQILPGVIELVLEPEDNYQIVEHKNHDLTIVILHLYHIIAFKNLGFYDYFHHIIFVLFGVVPTLLFVNYNQTYYHIIACSGFPGVIEYGTLTLYKNDKISLYTQKFINSLLYNYIRLPMCIFGVTMNYTYYRNNYIGDDLFITLYINTLLYFNGTIFTYLTCDSFSKLKYKLSLKND